MEISFCLCSGPEQRGGRQAGALSEDLDTSWRNPDEAAIVAKVVATLLKDKSISCVSDIGVVTPYRGQVCATANLIKDTPPPPDTVCRAVASARPTIPHGRAGKGKTRPGACPGGPEKEACHVGPPSVGTWQAQNTVAGCCFVGPQVCTACYLGWAPGMPAHK